MTVATGSGFEFTADPNHWGGTVAFLVRLGKDRNRGGLVGILQSRKGLILGVANEKSIAWGVARACHREGAELGFNYLG